MPINLSLTELITLLKRKRQADYTVNELMQAIMEQLAQTTTEDEAMIPIELQYELFEVVSKRLDTETTLSYQILAKLAQVADLNFSLHFCD